MSFFNPTYIKTFREYLLKFAEAVTNHPRYHPEDHELDKKLHWTSTIWVANMFRFYEWLFGRGYGIRREIVSGLEEKNGIIVATYKLYSFEAHIVHIEVLIRQYLYVLQTFLISFLTLSPLPKLDYRPVYLTFGLLGIVFSLHTSTRFLPLFGLGIAIDNSTDSGVSTGTTSITWSHTNTGSNLLFWVGMLGESGSDIVTGATYNTVGMTLVPTNGKIQTPSERWIYLFSLINPATGAHNAVVSSSPANSFWRGFGVSYTGVRQSGQPDASNKNSTAGGTSLTTSVTTVADRCWVILFGKSGTSGDATAGTGAHLVKTSGGNGVAIFDSNADITPPGSTSMTVTASPSQAIATIMASFAPVAPANNIVNINQAVNRASRY